MASWPIEQFLKIAREEKRNYWRRRIDSIKSDQDLYKVVNWHKLGPATKAPPLAVDGKVIEDTMGKARA